MMRAAELAKDCDPGTTEAANYAILTLVQDFPNLKPASGGI
jgi:hypothetical protein